jgi:hypothetical protein
MKLRAQLEINKTYLLQPLCTNHLSTARLPWRAAASRERSGFCQYEAGGDAISASPVRGSCTLSAASHSGFVAWGGGTAARRQISHGCGGLDIKQVGMKK